MEPFAKQVLSAIRSPSQFADIEGWTQLAGKSQDLVDIAMKLTANLVEQAERMDNIADNIEVASVETYEGTLQLLEVGDLALAWLSRPKWCAAGRSSSPKQHGDLYVNLTMHGIMHAKARLNSGGLDWVCITHNVTTGRANASEKVAERSGISGQ
jgi:hypothetical protein